MFALRCKQEGIIPRSLAIRPPINIDQGRRIACRAGHQLLRERLRLPNFKLRELEEEQKWREIGIRRMVSEEVYERIKRMMNERAEFEFIRTKDRQMRKFSKLQEVRRAPETATQSQKQHETRKRWVLNLSAHQLSTHQETALERGFNFATVPAKLPKEDIIAGVEVALRRQKKQPQERQERARAAVANILRTAKPPPSNLRKEERIGMKELRDKPVTILCADKGNATVVLDTSAYEKKANDILKKNAFQKASERPDDPE